NIHNRGAVAVASFGTLALVPGTSDTVFAASDKGIWKSVDGGASWTAANAGLDSLRIISLGQTGSTIVPAVATRDWSSLQTSAYKSSDGGASWTPTNLSSSRAGKMMFASHPDAPTTIFATGTWLTLSKSLDAGGQWFGAGPFLQPGTWGLVTIGGSPG